jgi:hypothetical protein
MNARDKELLRLFRDLPPSAQSQLLEFAAFLAARYQKAQEPLAAPNLIPASENESVVGALKRLSASFPMLDKAKLLNETSILVSQHVMQGRDKIEVIEEMEAVFHRHYQRYIGANDESND